MKKLLLINYLFISLTCLANDTIFSNANKLYSESNYVEACNLYLQIIEQGSESAELYFNIGNCYFRTNDWANAIWFFEKSLQLEKKKETQKNLELTRLNIEDTRIIPITAPTIILCAATRVTSIIITPNSIAIIELSPTEPGIFPKNASILASESFLLVKPFSAATPRAVAPL